MKLHAANCYIKHIVHTKVLCFMIVIHISKHGQAEYLIPRDEFNCQIAFGFGYLVE